MEIVEYAVRGIPTGCVYALVAVGLVLTYKTSGVFNLAYAGQAYASAAVFFILRKEQGWPLVWAALVAIVVVGPAIGLLLERLLFRHLRSASGLAKLVTTLGLLIVIPEVVRLVIGAGSKRNPPPLWWVMRTDEWLWPEGARIVLNAGQVATIVATCIVVALLVVIFRFTHLGLQMRAVVESARMAELHGVNSNRVSMVAWGMSSLLAGLAGVLLAPLFAALNPLDLFTLLVAALAATVVGGLTSIPLAFAGGLGLGVVQAVLAGVMPTNNILTAGLRPSLPFVVLFALLVLRPGLRQRESVDPLAGVDPPPAPPAEQSLPEALVRRLRVLALVTVALGLVGSLVLLDAYWLGLVVRGVILAVIMLSIVMVVGVGGMLSLSQAAFAAIGAFTTARLVAETGTPVLLALLVGAGVAGLVGALLAVPVVRLDGVYLALATLAFALMFGAIFVPLDWVSGGAAPLGVPRPRIGPIDFSSDRSFLLLAAGCVAVVGIVVTRLRQGTTGRYLEALQTSAVGAAAVGIRGGRTRVTAFAIAAAMAGFGGGLMASFIGQANYELSFTYLVGLVWVALVVSTGSRSVAAAIVAGLSFFIVPGLLSEAFAWPGNWVASNPGAPGAVRSVLGVVSGSWATPVSFILFGLGAVMYARHPEGSLVAPLRRVAARMARRYETGQDAGDPTPGSAATGVGTAP